MTILSDNLLGRGWLWPVIGDLWN